MRKTLFQFAMALVAAVGLADDRGSFYLDGSLIHYIDPAEQAQEYPVIMIPGANLSSYVYLATPDGRISWAQHFADAGYTVYVVNDPKYDFSRGFDVPGFEDVPTFGAPPADPNAEQGWQRDIWRRWGFGPSEGNPYPDSLFPSDHFGDFEANYPYLSSTSENYAANVARLLGKYGPAILVAHSAGGPRAVTAAKTHPEQVAGLVLVEPTGPPTGADFPALAGISMFGIYGDYVESRNQTNRKLATEAAAELFAANGGAGEVVSLPDDLGINGNSHLLMQGRNNEFSAGLILDWLEENADPPSGGGGGGGGASRFFQMLDTDSDGFLTSEEFGNGRRYRSASDAEIAEAFAKLDSDSDGKLTPEEFSAAMSGRVRGKGKGRKGG